MEVEHTIDPLTEIGGKLRAKYIWIDALCINQDNLSERAAQVKIMNRIYSGAQMTTIWLGNEDYFTRPALTVLQHLLAIPTRKALASKSSTILSALIQYELWNHVVIPSLANRRLPSQFPREPNQQLDVINHAR